VAAPFVNRNAYAFAGAPRRTYSKRAVDLVRQSVVIDMLAPLKIEATPAFFTAPLSAKDTEEFRSSGITAFHHAFGIGGPTAHEQALAYLAIWGNYVARNTQVFVGVDKAADIVRAKAEGKCAVIMGLQNADEFDKVADVKEFYQIGLRCAQLTYNSQNRIGSGSTDRVDGGVSDYGESIVKAMNEVGMLVDVSHSGDRTTLDAIALSTKPIAITHSNCRALINHPRVKTDEAIRALGAKGGVMGITGVRNFVTAKEPTTLGSIVDHIDHVVKLVGIDHVGIGTDSDLNGYDDVSPAMNKMLRGAYKDSYAFREKIDVDGFDHPRKMFDLTEELIRRGYSDANIQAVLGGNFQRLLTSTWGG
jgi:membrane dipeptidase